MFFTRDLLAEYIRAGNWHVETTEHAGTVDDPKTIAEALVYAANHPGSNANDAGAEGFFFKGIVSRQANLHSNTTGDLRSVYVIDENSTEEMQIYYMKKCEDANLDNGKNWSGIDDLQIDDEIVFWGRPFYYNSNILEFSSGAWCYSINGVLTD